MPDRGYIWRQTMVDVTTPDYRYFRSLIQHFHIDCVCRLCQLNTSEVTSVVFRDRWVSNPYLTNYLSGVHALVCRYIIYASPLYYMALILAFSYYRQRTLSQWKVDTWVNSFII